jgi:hypothetical protein
MNESNEENTKQKSLIRHIEDMHRSLASLHQLVTSAELSLQKQEDIEKSISYQKTLFQGHIPSII